MKFDTKNGKVNLNLPVYDTKSQSDYIAEICKEIDFPIARLVSYIFADFIFLVQKGLIDKKLDLNTILFEYFVHQERQSKSFNKLKEKVKNAE